MRSTRLPKVSSVTTASSATGRSDVPAQIRHGQRGSGSRSTTMQRARAWYFRRRSPPRPCRPRGIGRIGSRGRPNAAARAKPRSTRVVFRGGWLGTPPPPPRSVPASPACPSKQPAHRGRGSSARWPRPRPASCRGKRQKITSGNPQRRRRSVSTRRKAEIDEGGTGEDRESRGWHTCAGQFHRAVGASRLAQQHFAWT